VEISPLFNDAFMLHMCEKRLMLEYQVMLEYLYDFYIKYIEKFL
jgi:hypothetical protein